MFEVSKRGFKIKFKNGYAMSVIFGEFANTDGNENAELGLFTPHGDWMILHDYVDNYAPATDVVGHVSAETVAWGANRLAEGGDYLDIRSDIKERLQV